MKTSLSTTAGSPEIDAVRVDDDRDVGPSVNGAITIPSHSKHVPGLEAVHRNTEDGAASIATNSVDSLALESSEAAGGSVTRTPVDREAATDQRVVASAIVSSERTTNGTADLINAVSDAKCCPSVPSDVSQEAPRQEGVKEGLVFTAERPRRSTRAKAASQRPRPQPETSKPKKTLIKSPNDTVDTPEAPEAPETPFIKKNTRTPLKIELVSPALSNASSSSSSSSYLSSAGSLSSAPSFTSTPDLQVSSSLSSTSISTSAPETSPTTAVVDAITSATSSDIGRKRRNITAKTRTAQVRNVSTSTSSASPRPATTHSTSTKGKQKRGAISKESVESSAIEVQDPSSPPSSPETKAAGHTTPSKSRRRQGDSTTKASDIDNTVKLEDKAVRPASSPKAFTSSKKGAKRSAIDSKASDHHSATLVEDATAPPASSSGYRTTRADSAKKGAKRGRGTATRTNDRDTRTEVQDAASPLPPPSEVLQQKASKRRRAASKSLDDDVATTQDGGASEQTSSPNDATKGVEVSSTPCASSGDSKSVDNFASEDGEVRLDDPLKGPFSWLVEHDMDLVVTFDNYVKFPKSNQDAFVKALPDVIQNQERYVKNGMATELLFTNCPAFTRAFRDWQKALSVGKFTREYAIKCAAAKEAIETDAKWKTEAFEEYYGEKAVRDIERNMNAGPSTKISLAKIGLMQGIKVGDQLRYRRSIELKSGSKTKEDSTSAHTPGGLGRKDVVANAVESLSTPTDPIATSEATVVPEALTASETRDEPVASANSAESIEVDMRLRVVSLLPNGMPCASFELKRAPEAEGETEEQYQERLAANPIYDINTAVNLESLCLKQDGRVPKAYHKGIDAWKNVDVIRGTCLVGSLFGIRMDMYKKLQVDQAREAALKGEGMGEEEHEEPILCADNKGKKEKGKGKKGPAAKKRKL